MNRKPQPSVVMVELQPSMAMKLVDKCLQHGGYNIMSKPRKKIAIWNREILDRANTLCNKTSKFYKLDSENKNGRGSRSNSTTRNHREINSVTKRRRISTLEK